MHWCSLGVEQWLGCPGGQGQPNGCGPVVAGNRAVLVAAISGAGLTGAVLCVCRCSQLF